MEYTRFTNLDANVLRGGFRCLNSQVVSMEDSVELTEDRINTMIIQFSCSAASKTLTLNLENKQMMFIANFGETNAVTVKARKGDTGVSIGTGKIALVVASVTPNASKFYILN